MERWDDETVDLIYLDPPFNSNATYNVLYATDSAGGAQTRAFTDTWTWDAAAGARVVAYEAATARPAHKAIVGLEGMLGPSGMLAYVSYMAERLEHMYRLLKPTGSLYLHCDATASHYLKVVLDAIFGPGTFARKLSGSATKDSSAEQLGSFPKRTTSSCSTRNLVLLIARSIHSTGLTNPNTCDDFKKMKTGGYTETT